MHTNVTFVWMSNVRYKTEVWFGHMEYIPLETIQLYIIYLYKHNPLWH